MQDDYHPALNSMTIVQASSLPGQGIVYLAGDCYNFTLMKVLCVHLVNFYFNESIIDSSTIRKIFVNCCLYRTNNYIIIFSTV